MTITLSTRPSSKRARQHVRDGDGDVDIDRDRVLVERTQAGDRAAFDQLYSIYYRRLCRFCASRLQDAHEAEDVAQEAFARAYRALPNFAGERRFYPWLSVIAGHLCSDLMRKRNHVQSVGEWSDENIASDEDNGEELAVASYEAQTVAKAFTKLSSRHQRVLQLREGLGWSYDRIADHEGVKVSAIETLLFRARKSLRDQYSVLSQAGGRLGVVGALLSATMLRQLLKLPLAILKRAGHALAAATSAAVGPAVTATVVVAATFGAHALGVVGQSSAPSGNVAESAAAGHVPGAIEDGAPIASFAVFAANNAGHVASAQATWDSPTSASGTSSSSGSSGSGAGSTPAGSQSGNTGSGNTGSGNPGGGSQPGGGSNGGSGLNLPSTPNAPSPPSTPNAPQAPQTPQAPQGPGGGGDNGGGNGGFGYQGEITQAQGTVNQTTSLGNVTVPNPLNGSGSGSGSVGGPTPTPPPAPNAPSGSGSPTSGSGLPSLG